MLIGSSPTLLKCKNAYPVVALVEETAVQTVVGSIVWAFCRLKKLRCRKMSAPGYALHRIWVCIRFVKVIFVHALPRTWTEEA